jgi:hypothetical protein
MASMIEASAHGAQYDASIDTLGCRGLEFLDSMGAVACIHGVCKAQCCGGKQSNRSTPECAAQRRRRSHTTPKELEEGVEVLGT